MGDPLSLREPVAEICRLLGVRPNRVGAIRIKPSEAEVVVFLERNGKMYIDPDTNLPAVETRKFPVLT